MSTPFVYLQHRCVIALQGPDTIKLLERLITAQTNHWPVGEARYGALLSPQGKIISDFLALRDNEGVLLDVPRNSSEALVQKLKMFRMRSDVDIEIATDLLVLAEPAPATNQVRPVSGAKYVFLDPRYDQGRLRIFAPADEWAAWHGPSAAEWSQPVDAYHTDRTMHGIAEQDFDFDSLTVFPADINMDLLGGVDLKKGCFIGQEVVSRMHRRGNIRKRTLTVRGAALVAGAPVMAELPIGEITSAIGDIGLARLRLDRLAKAISEQATVSANGTPVEIPVDDNIQLQLDAFKTT